MWMMLWMVACTGPADSGKTDDSTGGTGGDPVNGEALFGSCAGCHGADGTGGIDIGGTPSTDLTQSVPTKTDTELEDIIKNGYGTAMPAQYSDAQDIADLIAYMRQTFP
jgi:mono/diheme cytochrome c family protein